MPARPPDPRLMPTWKRHLADAITVATLLAAGGAVGVAAGLLVQRYATPTASTASTAPTAPPVAQSAP